MASLGLLMLLWGGAAAYLPGQTSSYTTLGRRDLGEVSGVLNDNIGSQVDQRLRVATTRYPLIGFPSWARLHVAVVLYDSKESSGPFYLYDFLPVAPTDPSTAARLFAGRAVNGVVRCKALTYAPHELQDRGRCERSMEDIRAYCDAYDTHLRLLDNNCETFAEALVRYCRSKVFP